MENHSLFSHRQPQITWLYSIIRIADGKLIFKACNYSGTQLIDITCDFFDELVIPEFLQT